MVNVTNFVNNHLATVYSHPVNAARLQARGIPTPFVLSGPITSPPTAIDKPAVGVVGKLASFSQHFFTDSPQQNIDLSRVRK